MYSSGPSARRRTSQADPEQPGRHRHADQHVGQRRARRARRRPAGRAGSRRQPDAEHLQRARAAASRLPSSCLRGDDLLGDPRGSPPRSSESGQRQQRHGAGERAARARPRGRGERGRRRATTTARPAAPGPSQGSTATPMTATDAAQATASGIRSRSSSRHGRRPRRSSRQTRRRDQRRQQRDQPQGRELLDAALDREGVDERGLRGERGDRRARASATSRPAMQQPGEGQRQHRGDEGEEGLEAPGHVHPGQRPHGPERGVRAERVAAGEVRLRASPRSSTEASPRQSVPCVHDAVDQREVHRGVAEDPVARRTWPTPLSTTGAAYTAKTASAAPAAQRVEPALGSRARARPPARRRAAATSSGVASAAVASGARHARASTTMPRQPERQISSDARRRAGRPQPLRSRPAAERQQPRAAPGSSSQALMNSTAGVRLTAAAQAEDADQEGREEDLDPDDDQRGRQHRQALLGQRAEAAVDPDARR